MEEKQFIKLVKFIERSNQKILGRLNILIALEIRKEGKKHDKKVTRKNIKLLSRIGMDYKEIAEVLDMNPGTIANELTALKKKNG